MPRQCQLGCRGAPRPPVMRAWRRRGAAPPAAARADRRSVGGAGPAAQRGVWGDASIGGEEEKHGIGYLEGGRTVAGRGRMAAHDGLQLTPGREYQRRRRGLRD
jgi:hypothetical protein